MSNEHLKQLSNDIFNTRNSIKETKVEITNLLHNMPTIDTNILDRIRHTRRIHLLRFRLIGLRAHLRFLENKLILLLN
jgi:hypothetical protein